MDWLKIVSRYLQIVLFRKKKTSRKCFSLNIPLNYVNRITCSYSLLREKKNMFLSRSKIYYNI